MTLDDYRHFLSQNDPDEDVLREYLVANAHEDYGHTWAVGTVIDMNQIGKYQGDNVLKNLILLYNMISELLIMDTILNNKYQQSPHREYVRIMQKMMKVYARLCTAAKYNKYHHKLTIQYDTVLKDMNAC